MPSVLHGGGGATRPFWGIGHGGTPQKPNSQGRALRFRPEVKNGRRRDKDGAWEAQVRDNPEGVELDLTDDVHRRCKKNSLSFYSA